MTRYCCDRKCFIEPKSHVDGIACKKCECFSYCRCDCETFKEEGHNVPKKSCYTFYNTSKFMTCCFEACFKFDIEDIIVSHSFCPVCYYKLFCECVLKSKCKNRNSWGDP